VAEFTIPFDDESTLYTILLNCLPVPEKITIHVDKSTNGALAPLHARLYWTNNGNVFEVKFWNQLPCVAPGNVVVSLEAVWERPIAPTVLLVFTVSHGKILYTPAVVVTVAVLNRLIIAT